MKSKKTFLIVCVAALTLALALPFMGLFAFADSDSPTLDDLPISYLLVDSSYFIMFSGSSNVTYSCSGSLHHVSSDSTRTFDYLVINFYTSDGVTTAHSISYPFDGGTLLAISDTGIYCDSITIDSFSGSSSEFYSLITVLNGCGSYVSPPPPPPPDPLEPVSDGLDTVISVFGDVIDFIINTPDVAIFVAISVASCAIIPMGIILIKKLIKGY